MCGDKNPPRQDGGLSRQRRRYLDRELKKLIEGDGDCCGICHAALVHNCKTFYGVYAGALVLAGECCGSSKLECVVASGVYTQRDYDFLERHDAKNLKQQLSVDEIAEATTLLQRAISKVDQQVDDIQKRGGSSRVRMVVNIRDTV